LFICGDKGHSLTPGEADLYTCGGEVRVRYQADHRVQRQRGADFTFSVCNDNVHYELDGFDPSMLDDAGYVDGALAQSPQTRETGSSSRAAASFSTGRTLPPPPVHDYVPGRHAVDDFRPPEIPPYTRLRTHAEMLEARNGVEFDGCFPSGPWACAKDLETELFAWCRNFHVSGGGFPPKHRDRLVAKMQRGPQIRISCGLSGHPVTASSAATNKRKGGSQKCNCPWMVTFEFGVGGWWTYQMFDQNDSFPIALMAAHTHSPKMLFMRMLALVSASCRTASVSTLWNVSARPV